MGNQTWKRTCMKIKNSEDDTWSKYYFEANIPM